MHLEQYILYMHIHLTLQQDLLIQVEEERCRYSVQNIMEQGNYHSIPVSIYRILIYIRSLQVFKRARRHVYDLSFGKWQKSYHHVGLFNYEYSVLWSSQFLI